MKILALLIDSSLIRYGLKTEDEIKNFKRETLFDRKPITTKKINHTGYVYINTGFYYGEVTYS